MVRIHLFGRLRWSLDDQAQTSVLHAKTEALWTYLLLNQGQPQPRSHVAGKLWPRDPGPKARANLRRHLHELRRHLSASAESGEWLSVEASTLQWTPHEDVWLDVAEFDRAMSAAAPDPQALAAAVQIYSGDLLDGLDEAWIVPIRAQFRTWLLDTLVWLIEHHRDRQDEAQAMAYTQLLLHHDPTREDLLHQVMQWRTAAGDATGALLDFQHYGRQFEAATSFAPHREATTLVDRLTPSAVMNTALMAASTAEVPAAGRAPAEPPAPILHAGTSNLPAQWTSFVGREQEVAELRAMLTARAEPVRLLTLTGPGGSGKTRLALEVAARLCSEIISPFPGGVLFVSLANVQDPDAVVPAIVEAMAIQDIAGRPPLAALKEYLHDRRILLVLDNFEQVAGAAPVLTDLIRTASGLHCLVTSRVLLRLYGEHEYVVEPLPTPDLKHLPEAGHLAQVDSVALFVARYQAVHPDFALTPATARAVAEICVQLDGLPLAIELAAARGRLLSPAALLARLKDRLRFLQNRSLFQHERHQTLRATLDWSYQLLESEDRRLFSALAVFPESFDLEAAEAVWPEAGDLLSGFERLVENSLLQRLPDDPGDSSLGPRFCWLSTLHEFAHSLLRELPEANGIHERHARYFLGLAKDSGAQLRGHGQLNWLPRLEREHDNLRAALRWWLAGDAVQATNGLDMAAALGHFWFLAGHYTEGQQWLGQFTAAAGAVAPARTLARAEYAVGTLLHGQGDLRAAEPHFRHSLAQFHSVPDVLSEDEEGIADALYALGRLANRRQDYSGAEALLLDSLHIAERIGYTYRIAYIYNILAAICLARGERDTAGRYYGQGLDYARRTGNASGLAFFLTSMGEFARLQNDYARAEALYLEAMALAEKLQQKSRKVMLLHNLAYVVLFRGNVRRAAALFRECLTLGQELPDKENFGMCLLGLGGVAAAEQAWTRAATLFGAGEAVLTTIGAHLAPADQIEYDRYAQMVRDHLGTETFISYFDHGGRLTPDQVNALAVGGY